MIVAERALVASTPRRDSCVLGLRRRLALIGTATSPQLWSVRVAPGGR